MEDWKANNAYLNNMYTSHDIRAIEYNDQGCETVIEGAMHELIYQEPLGMYRIIKQLNITEQSRCKPLHPTFNHRDSSPVHHGAINNRPCCSEGYKRLSFS